MDTPRVLAPLLLTLAACSVGGANDLRDQVEDDDYRRTYDRAPGWESPRQPALGGPHGGFVDVYVNDVVADAIAEATDTQTPLDAWPAGSIIVKDGWEAAEGGDLDTLSIMERRSDGWFWAEWSGSGRLISAGLNDSTCTGCHAAGEDQVRAFPLPPY